MADRAPLRVLPSASDVIEPLRAQAAATGDPRVRSRLTQIAAALGDALAGDGALYSRSWTREPVGRIHMAQPPGQGVPGPRSAVNVRRHIVAGPGMACVSGDYRNMHAAIAARWTGDPALYGLVEGNAYAALARELLPEAPPAEGRARCKLALISPLNGATLDTLVRHLGSPEAAAAFWASLPARFPGLMARWQEAKRKHRTGRPVPIPSLSGDRVRMIPHKDGRGGWRRFLYALWAVTEAEAMDRVLASLPAGSRVAQPLYDGILLVCRVEDAERVARELREVMVAAARASGFECGVKVGIGDSWGEAEESAE
jgi:hypothetical protein